MESEDKKYPSLDELPDPGLESEPRVYRWLRIAEMARAVALGILAFVICMLLIWGAVGS